MYCENDIVRIFEHRVWKEEHRLNGWMFQGLFLSFWVVLVLAVQRERAFCV